MNRSKSRITRNVNIALRAERVIARRRLAVIRTQTGLVAFSGLVAGIGLIMLNVAAFFWLAASYGNPAAGLIIAVFNFVLAAVLVLYASRMSAEEELAPVAEVRDMAIEDIEHEFAGAVDEIRDVAGSLKAIARDPFGAALPSILGPVLAAIAKSLKK